MLYEIKIKVEKTDKDGAPKEVKEHYVVEAELHGDAEKMGYQMYQGRDADVFAVFRSDLREIVNAKQDDDAAYRAVVIDTYTDESGREKELKYPMLVFARDLSDAVGKMNEHLSQGYDMRLDAVRRVRIIDYVTE